MSSLVVAPGRDVARLVCAAVLTAFLFVIVAVTFLVIASGVSGGGDSLVAIVMYDVLLILAAMLSVWAALRVTRRLGTQQNPPVELDGPSQGRPLGLLAVALVPAVVATIAQVASRGAGAVRFLLDLVLLVAVGVAVVLREDQRASRG